MSVQQVMRLIGEDEYLELEKASEIRHEYVDGYLYAMMGGTRQHNKISVNIYTALRRETAGTPCEVYMSDVKLRIPHKRSFYYPDLMLGCSREDNDEYYLVRPCLIVEILSKSTAATDRREKLVAYQSIPSLREYFLVSQSGYRVERYHRLDEAGSWHLTVYEQGDSVSFSCIDYQLGMDDIYAEVLDG